MIIKRNIYKEIVNSVESKPVTLISGARQVGKYTLALMFKDRGFNYVSLDNSRDRELATKDPEMFLAIHPWPLIIDEVQRAPILFEGIEEIVNKEKIKRNDNYGMYILTGSQMYKLMNGVTESLAGRVSIIHVLPLSRNEIIERDVCQIINIKDQFLFRRFMELLASLTGEELVYDNVAKIIGVDKKTVVAWLSVLIAGDIVYLLEPYNEISIAKRIVKRPKIYFNDTGLACYLAKLNSAEVLQASSFSDRFVETYIINEIRKSFVNNGTEPNFYYYRDSNMNEIDLVIISDGKLHRVECKSGISFNNSVVKGFKQLDKTEYKIGAKVIICNTDTIYPLDDDVYVLPLAGI